MPRDAAGKLVEFLHEQAGEYLRGVLHYSTDDCHVLYLRTDVDSLYSGEELNELCAYWRQRSEESDEGPFSLGNLHCTVQFYDESLLFHFAQGTDVGTVVTLDPEAGRDIVTFITRSLEHLHHHSPQTISNAPTWLQG